MTVPQNRLLILRHARSSWSLPGQSDHQRPLDEHGREEASRIGALMEREGHRADIVLCSSAVRATQTLDGIRNRLPGAFEEVVCDALYAHGLEGYYRKVREFGAASAILVVGHNPMVGEFSAEVAGGGEGAALAVLRRGFPTGALAVLGFNRPLSGIEPGTGHLSKLHCP